MEHISHVTGDSLVQMEDSTTEYVKDLQPGDILYHGYRVKVVIKTIVEDTIPMVLFNTGLGITPWNPVYENGKWVYPFTLDYIIRTYVKEYYNLVLDKGHMMNVNGFYVATLGYKFTDNDMIQDPYDTKNIVEELQNHPDWSTGYITLDASSMKKNWNSPFWKKRAPSTSTPCSESEKFSMP